MSDGDNRVRRGGCWFDSAEFAHVAYRFGVDPASRVGILGFRLVHEADTPRVLRGGSWFYSQRVVGAANCDTVEPGDGYDFLGFRLAKEST